MRSSARRYPASRGCIIAPFPFFLRSCDRRHRPRKHMAQYVFTMNRVGKVVPPKRVILKDISLSFFPGAKIGVLGLNGSGKSSLLRIMAGGDQKHQSDAGPVPKMHIGLLPP